MRPQAVKGTHDILADQAPLWRLIEETVRRTLERAGAHELRTPVFEHSEVFTKAAGESSDLMVQKEMYTLTDRGERQLTLRPEFTPGTLRSYIQHGMHTLPSPVRLWSMGPVFRAENVQRGRYRQFHQVNFEVLGSDSAVIDAETISLLYDTLMNLGLKGLRVRLGSVGDPQDRQAYNAYLKDQLEPLAGKLSATSQERLRLNPMRLLDAKDPGDQELIKGLKRPLDFLNDDARAHFDRVAAHLEAWEIPFDLDPAIVRGLDYYRRTAFEVHHPGIGAQSALSGGGRYDGLVENLGGPATPAIGWAFGVERVLDAMDADGVTGPAPAAPSIHLVPLDEAGIQEAATMARRLRQDVSATYTAVRRNPGKGLRDADRSGATYAGLRGDREREDRVWQVRHLESGVQHAVPEGDLPSWLAATEATS